MATKNHTDAGQKGMSLGCYARYLVYGEGACEGCGKCNIIEVVSPSTAYESRRNQRNQDHDNQIKYKSD